MDLVRFQVGYWRVSKGKKSGVDGRSAADGGETHTKMRCSMIPYGLGCGLVMTDADKSQTIIPTSPRTLKIPPSMAYTTSCDSYETKAMIQQKQLRQ